MATYGIFTKDNTTVYTIPGDLTGYTVQLTTTKPVENASEINSALSWTSTTILVGTSANLTSDNTNIMVTVNSEQGTLDSAASN